jgi:hypothetical protein
LNRGEKYTCVVDESILTQIEIDHLLTLVHVSLVDVHRDRVLIVANEFLQTHTQMAIATRTPTDEFTVLCSIKWDVIPNNATVPQCALRSLRTVEFSFLIFWSHAGLR